ncbi:molybdopterin molybdotransferase MoeA [Algoriphagus algorifonticola]|uniref:molybdopterin molybdotransferase MoeA n=1 Tax=Algoriphagus algorifonticola TaxID=2593007 RepID=UPI00119D6F88|nr:molybdopterin molybdotransferase MoeA [Algoriphagus algorifonticola]
MISVPEAKKILQNIPLNKRSQLIPLSESEGLFLGYEVRSLMDVPSFDNSAMDGYAFIWEEGLKELEIIGESAAGGDYSQQIKNGQCIRIFTGAPMPEGADSVIMQEKVEKNGAKINFNPEDAIQGQHVRYQGSQCKKGDLVAQAGAKITPGLISLMASVGVGEIPVFQPPKVSILTTGNEIKNLGEILTRGQIYNANGPALDIWLKSLGIREIQHWQVRDEKKAVQDIISKALAQSDLVLITGGISVGDYDFVKEALEFHQVEPLFYKVKQRPGKPLYAGMKKEKLVFALPGNPASVLSCFLNYVKPVIESWKGNSKAWDSFVELPISADFEKPIPLTQFLKAKVEDGKIHILSGQESFNLISFGTADGFAEIPEKTTFIKAGQTIKFYPW